jgi:dsDNA-specific endonuclease/ATPase MutS2
MASPLARITAFFSRSDEQGLPLARPVRKSGFLRLSNFLSRPSSPAGPSHDVSNLADLLSAMRESVDRQNQRQDELLTYLSQVPKALEHLPENTRVQAESLAGIRQFLENQSSTSRQMSVILDKVGQATVDQRKILDSVRQRLDTLHESDQKVAEHFSSFAGALATSSDTTRLAGEMLKALETNIRQRDEALERILNIQQRRHTILMTAAVILSAASLVATAIGIHLASGGR